MRLAHWDWRFVCRTNLAYLLKPKKPSLLQYSLTRPGTASPRIFLPPQVPSGLRFSGKSLMRKASARWFAVSACIVLLCATISCAKPPDPNTLVMMIESSPTNLDPRVGLDAQSERIDELIFDALLTRDEHLNVQPGLAERWETPDPLTYIFHLHRGVTFHDGRP